MFRVSLSKKTDAGGEIRQRWDPTLETVAMVTAISTNSLKDTP